MTRRDAGEQARQVSAASDRIKDILGVTPVGFRAPGYTVSDELLTVVRDCGILYDSSVFPSLPYYMAKAGVLLRMRLSHRDSRSVLGAPGVVRAPAQPYRIGEPYWTSGAGLLELPIQVAGPLRLPFIGTSLSLLGPTAAKWFTRHVIGSPLINLELHGIDFLDAQDVPGALGSVQPHLNVPLSRKLDTFMSVLHTVRHHGYSCVRLDEAAQAFG